MGKADKAGLHRGVRIGTLFAMTSAVQRQATLMRDVAGSLDPDLLADGHEPEARVVYGGLSWERYLALDEVLEQDRSVPRLYYLDGDLEIMSTSDEHERIKKWIADFLSDYLLELDVDVMSRGQATMQLTLKQAAAEPDESWCLGAEGKFPDLVLEIALSSGGVRKLELYQRFGIPEVWIWRKGKLEVHALSADGSGYERVPDGSRALPGLDMRLLERCVNIPGWREARKAFRAGLASGQ